MRALLLSCSCSCARPRSCLLSFSLVVALARCCSRARSPSLVIALARSRSRSRSPSVSLVLAPTRTRARLRFRSRSLLLSRAFAFVLVQACARACALAPPRSFTFVSSFALCRCFPPVCLFSCSPDFALDLGFCDCHSLVSSTVLPRSVCGSSRRVYSRAALRAYGNTIALLVASLNSSSNKRGNSCGF